MVLVSELSLLVHHAEELVSKMNARRLIFLSHQESKMVKEFGSKVVGMRVLVVVLMVI